MEMSPYSLGPLPKRLTETCVGSVFIKHLVKQFGNSQESGHALIAPGEAPRACFTAVNFQDMAPLNIGMSPRVNGKWQEALII